MYHSTLLRGAFGLLVYLTHNNTHPTMTIIAKGASIAVTQAQQTQQPGGPLNRKLQADWAYSCLRYPVTRMPRTTIKHAMKNLQRNNKKCSHVTLAPHVTRATLAGQVMHTINCCRPEWQQNKHALQRQQRRHKLANFDKKMKAGCVVVVPFASLTIKPPTFLDNDLDFMDTILMGLDSIDDAVLKGPNDVTNPFNFNEWRSTASRTSESTTSTKYLEIVRYKSGLQNSNELSSLKTADSYSTISMVAFTGNAPKSTSTQSVCHIITDEV